MRILKTYDEAFQIASECIQNKTKSKGTKLKNPPPEVKGPWEQTREACEHTLKYVMEKLHHSCYMLCVQAGEQVFYKLENPTTAPDFLPAFKNIRKTMKSQQKKSLQKTLKSKQWRVMQCVVKPYKEESTTTVEYPRWFSGIRVPDGVYILNLTDAVLLRKDGKEPFPMVTGLKPLGEYNFPSHLPILSGSGQTGYWDIPFPNYDDVRLVMGYDKVGTPELDWSAKKNVAVFRGGPTGCGYTVNTNMRLKLASMRSELLDVGIVQNKSGSLKFDPVEGLGSLETTQKKVGFLDLMKDQSTYKYIIHVDGNVAAYRLLKSMLTGSLILRVKSPYRLWMDHKLEAGKHYVEVAEDLSDLESVIQWCLDHDKECKKIATRGLQFASKVLTLDFTQIYTETLLRTIHT